MSLFNFSGQIITIPMISMFVGWIILVILDLYPSNALIFTEKLILAQLLVITLGGIVLFLLFIRGSTRTTRARRPSCSYLFFFFFPSKLKYLGCPHFLSSKEGWPLSQSIKITSINGDILILVRNSQVETPALSFIKLTCSSVVYLKWESTWESSQKLQSLVDALVP